MAKQARGGKSARAAEAASGKSDGAAAKAAATAAGTGAARSKAAPVAPVAKTTTAAKSTAAKSATAAKSRLPVGSIGWIGALAAAALGLVLFCFGAYALKNGGATLRPLSLALMLVGGAEVVLGWRAIGRSRSAWSFLMSINGTSFVVFLFGSPKLRDTFHTALGVALIPCILFAATTVCLSLAAHEYGRR